MKKYENIKLLEGEEVECKGKYQVINQPCCLSLSHFSHYAKCTVVLTKLQNSDKYSFKYD